MNSEIKPVLLPNIKDIFETLNPGDSLTHRYLYRGQRKSYVEGWPLAPLALRGNSKKLNEMTPLFVKDGKKSENKDEKERIEKLKNTPDILQRYKEFRIINRFIHLADDAGVVLPGDDSIFREKLFELRMNHKKNSTAKDKADRIKDIKKNFKYWPPRIKNLEKSNNTIANASWCAVIALAQHYKLPTRFLDWSISPYVALFQAASCVVEKEATKEKMDLESSYFYVYKLDTTQKKLDKKKLVVFPVPGGLNPNLTAQKGRLTYLNNIPETDQRKGYENIKGIKDAIEIYQIPCKFAREVLEKLKAMNISHDTMFPSLQEIANSMRIRANYLSLKWKDTWAKK